MSKGEAAMTLGAWTPDTPDKMDQAGELTVCSGVFPRTQTSYGPLTVPAPYSGALSARCQGAFTAHDSAGNTIMFAGDVSKLYKLGSDLVWADKSQVGGYSTATDVFVEFDQFDQVVLATNNANNVQYWDLSSSVAFADMPTNCPKARHSAVWDPGFYVLGNVPSFPNRVQWSTLQNAASLGIADATSWPAPGSSAAATGQSGYSDLRGGGWVQALTGPVGGAQGTVVCESSIFRVEYIGPGGTFAFREVVRGCGTPAPASVVTAAVSVGVVLSFMLTDDGFRAFDGSSTKTIGHQRVDKFFYNEVDQSYIGRVMAIPDPLNKQIIWGYPIAGSMGNLARWLLYNWDIDRWSYCDDASIVAEILCRMSTVGYTLDGLDATGYTLDTLPYSLDSRFWMGGKPALAMFDSSHKLNFFSSSRMAARLETAEIDAGDGRRLYGDGVRILSDGGAVTGQIGYRDTPRASLTYTTATSPDDDEVCHTAIDARLLRARANIAAGGTWNHIYGVSGVIRPTGKR